MRARALLFVLSLLAGCSLVNAPSDHREPVPATEFCQQFAEISCAGFLDCCPTAPPLDFDACVEVAAMGCTEDFGAIVVNPQTGYSEEAAARVAYQGRSLVASCDLELADWVNERTGFQSVLAGTIAGGERCDMPEAPSLENLAPLFSCESTDQACALAGSIWQCSARREAGESCVLGTDCRSGLYCTLIGRTCEPRQLDGAACVSNDSCESLACRDFVCAPRTLETVYCGMMAD